MVKRYRTFQCTFPKSLVWNMCEDDPPYAFCGYLVCITWLWFAVQFSLPMWVWPWSRESDRA